MFDDLLSRLPAEPPRSLKALPGLAWRAQAAPALVMPLGFVLLFFLFPVFVASTDPEFRLQIGQTATAEATVVSLGDCHSRNEPAALVFAFTAPDGVLYRGRSADCQAAAESALQPGQKLAVKFLPADPSINAPIGSFWGNNTPPLAFFLLFPLFPAFFILPLVLPPLLSARRNRRIARKGLLADGVVVYAKTGTRAIWPGMRDAGPAEVFVAYRRPDGEAVEARTRCPNTWLLNRLAPGSPVRIAYLPGAPRAVVLLDAFIR